MKKIILYLTFCCTCIVSYSQTATWTNLGPIPFPQKTIGQVHGIGRVSEIRFHPSNPNKMYCASASGGLWKSDNKGVNWSSIGTDAITNVQSASVAVDPSNDQVIYWGTGDANYYSSGFGVYKTTNGGTTWLASNSGMGNRLVIELLILPTDNQIIVAATNSGIYKSTNSGANWALKSASGIQFNDMVFKPGSNGQTIYAAAQKGFYRSVDAGETWTQISSATFVFSANGCRVAVSNSNPNIVYFSNVGANTACEMYKSTDGGSTWVNARTESAKALAGYDASGGGQGNYNFDIEVSPTNANELYVCGHLIWRSTDGGATWTQQQVNWATNLHTDQHHILFDPYVSGQLWNANDGGVWSNKTNGTGAWTPMSDGIAATEIYRAASSNISKDIAYIGTQDNGGFYYSNGIWYNDRGGDWGPEEFFDFATNYVYCDELGTRKLYPARTNQNLNLPFTPSNTAKSKFAFTPANTSIGYVSNAGKIYRCNNLTTSTPSWTLIYTLPSGSVSDLDIDPSDANELYIIANNQLIYRSDNASTANVAFQSYSLPSATNNKAWVASINGTSIVYAACNAKIYRSMDKGANWTDVSAGFPNANINGLVADRNRAAAEAIYASYANGVYYRDNSKTSWSNYAQGLPIVCDITDLFYFADASKQGYLRVSYYGRGMWETPMVGATNNISVALTTPTNGTSFTSLATINLAATASTTNGNITKVEFYNGNSLLSSDNLAPYSFVWNNVNLGSYELKAIAYDNLGNSRISSSAFITVNLQCNKLIGTAIGTSPPYAVGSEFNKAFDGNINTFVDLQASNGGFTGLDLGVAKAVTALRFYPRNGQEARMDGGVFQASNSANFGTGVATLHTISGEPALEWNEVAINNSTPYRYVRYLSPTGGYCNVAEIEFCGVSSNLSPTVAITNPANNSVLQEGSNVNITVNAADTDGTVSKVEYYQGSTLIGQSSTSPFSFTWTNPASGTYNLFAVVTDNLGAKDSSSLVVLKINKLPLVSITAPINNAVVNQGVAININVTASDADGTISKVEYYQGTTLLGQSTTSPFNFVWNNAAFGTYSLTAKAYDNNGGVATSIAIALVVNRLPVISITSPLNNSTLVEGSIVNIAVNVTDTDGNISKVEYFNGSTKLGETSAAPFSFSISNLVGGNYSLTAKATDNRNAVSTSSSVSLFVNKIPIVSLTAPLNNTVINAGTNLLLNADASDQDGGIKRIEFYRGTTLIGTDSISPFNLTVNSMAAGNYVFTAKAFDNLGASATSVAVNVKVNAFPLVNITSPATATIFNEGVTIVFTANATDPDGSIAKVEYFNGTISLGQSTTSPFNLSLNNLSPGVYTIVAKASDNNGSISSSNAISITVNSLPSISITSPVNNAVFVSGATIVLAVNAFDSDGTIAKVEYYNGGTLLGQSTTAPFGFTLTNAVSGNYNITAKATDNRNATKTSGAISITVNTPVNTPPSVTITSPTNNTIFMAGSNILLQAKATDADGSISKVEFYNGNSLIGQSNAAPFNFNLISAPFGIYSITAKAYDNSNSTATSGIVTLNVKRVPTIAIISPSNNAVQELGKSFSIITNVTDQDAAISSVDFYFAGVKIGNTATSLFQVSYSHNNSGTFVVEAKAKDINGNVIAQSSTNLIVNKLPTITLVSPTASIFYESDQMVLTANANDIDGTISKVEFFNGNTLLTTQNGLPYTYSINNLTKGNYAISAKAYDNLGSIGVSTVLNIQVKTKPTITINSPTNSAILATGTSQLSLSANDPDAQIAKIEYFYNSVKIGESTSAPYLFNYTVAVGNQIILAKALNKDNLVLDTKSVKVFGNISPVVSIISPKNNTVVNEGESVKISFTATDANDKITKADFYKNNVKINTIVGQPFEFNLTENLYGTYQYQVKAYDSLGWEGASNLISLKVNALPELSFIQPQNQAIVWSSDTILIDLKAKDLDGIITKITLFDGGLKIAEATNSPYQFKLVNLTPGSHTLIAKATDNDNATKSVELEILVKDKATASTDKLLDTDLSVYPNPSYGKFTISLGQVKAKQAFYKIVDMAGNEVVSKVELEKELQSSILKEVVLPSVTSGNYILHLYLDNEVITKKIQVLRVPKTN